MKRIRQNGFALVELLLILVIVGIIAFVAWRVIDAVGDADNAANQVDGSTVAPADVPEAKTTDDLNTLQSQLNDATVDDDTQTKLDSESTF